MATVSNIIVKPGDKGQTSLANGERLFKCDIRINALGAIEEANAFIGLARQSVTSELQEILAAIQNNLFDASADLLLTNLSTEDLHLTACKVVHLERWIDTYNKSLPPVSSFILPGGSAAAAVLHVCRTTVRRAEREVVNLSLNSTINPVIIQYLNRLSDLLFVLSRVANQKGKLDTLWISGYTFDN